MGFVVLIIIAIIGLMVISAVVKGNRRMQYADTEQALREAQEGRGRMPSWSLNDSKAHEFFYIVGKFAVRNGVPEAYVKQAFSQPTLAALICAQIAGNMETKGATFNAQKLAATEVFRRVYRDMTAEKRARFVTPVAELEKIEKAKREAQFPVAVHAEPTTDDEFDAFTETWRKGLNPRT